MDCLPFTTERTFQAPQSVLFEVWTSTDHIVQWLPPTGLEMDFLRASIEQGGSAFYVMHADEVNFRIYFRATYEVIESPTLLIYTQEFCDENGDPSRHPFAPMLPRKLRATARFSSTDAHSTTISLTLEPIGDLTPEERETFNQSRVGMTQGWTKSFDKLKEYLTQHQVH